MKMLKRILSLALMATVLMEMAMAANYTVGAPGGEWDQSTDLQTWADSISFSEGDILIFQFTTNHDVTEVSAADFASCSASNPQQPPLTGGAAVVPLTSAGTRYFICGTGGHCLTGMKVAIAVAAASSPPPSTTPAVPSPPPSTTPAVPAPPPKAAVPAPPPKTAAPAPPPKQSKAASPPQPAPASNPPPAGSSIPPPPPAPSSAVKFEIMGGVAGLVLMIFLINV